MSTNEFGGGVDHDVRTVFERTDPVGCAEGVVNDDRDPVLMGDLRDRVDVRDITVGVAKRFQIDRACVVLDGAFDLCQIVGIHESGFDPVLRQCVGEQVEAAAVDGLL